MKGTPVKEPKSYGCLNCTPEQTTIINADRLCDVGFGMAILRVDDEVIDLNNRMLTLGEINEQYADKLKKCNVAEIVLDGPLHGETFELNTENGNWYLTEQNKGFA